MDKRDFQQELLEADYRPYRNWYDVGQHHVDLASIVGIGPLIEPGPPTDYVGVPSFRIYLASGYIIVEDSNAKALRHNLINLLEDEFGRSGRLEDRLPITERSNECHKP